MRKVTVWRGLAAATLIPVAWLVWAFLLNFHLEGPPEQAVTADERDVPLSAAQTRIRIPLKQVEQFLENRLKSQGALVSGTTERLAIDIVRSTLGLSVTEVVKCEPTEAARVAMDAIRCFDKITETGIKKSVEVTKCALKYGVDSWDTAFRIADACIEERSPVKFPDRPTEVQYAVHLNSLDLEMSGAQMQARALLRIDMVLPKGILETYFNAPRKKVCLPKVIATASLTPSLATDQDMLVLNADVGQVVLRAGPDCTGKVTRSSTQVFDGLKDQILLGLSVVFQDTLKTQLEEQLNDPEKLAEAQTQLAEAAILAQEPIPLFLPPPVDIPVFVVLNPEELFVSQVSGRVRGKTTELEISAGVLARPVVHLGDIRPAGAKALPLAVAQPGNRFSVTPVASLDLDRLSDEASKIAREVVADTLPDLRYRSLDVRLYQADKHIVIGVDIRGVGWLRLNGTVHLTAQPEFVTAESVVRLRDIKFDLDTTNFLLRRAAWILESPIEKVLEERLRFSLGNQFEQILAALAGFQHVIEKELDSDADAKKVFRGQIRGELRKLELDRIWLDRNQMNVSVRATGKTLLEVHELE